jgi:probable RNA-binding protein EIF1AD
MGRGKHVQKVLDELHEPTDGQEVARVSALPGGNLLEVTNAAGDSFLCRVPARFRNVFWIKLGALACPRHLARRAHPRPRAGGFLIVDRLAEAAGSSAGDVGKVQGTVAHLLYREQIKHLQARHSWPAAFVTEEASRRAAHAAGDDLLRANPNHSASGLGCDEEDAEEEDEDGEEYGEEEDDGEAAGDEAHERGGGAALT